MGGLQLVTHVQGYRRGSFANHDQDLMDPLQVFLEDNPDGLSKRLGFVHHRDQHGDAQGGIGAIEATQSRGHWIGIYLGFQAWFG